MEESSRESQPRCPCGFWGSAQTLGLCSVCYRQAHRNQNQGNSGTSDAGKAAVAACQSQNCSQGNRMDSQHFPSRSTADNLPSSLSSPPGERATLSSASSSPMDTAAPSGTATTTSHMPAPMNTGAGDVPQPEAATMTLQPCESLLSSDDSVVFSTESEDEVSFNKFEKNSSASNSYANLTSHSDECKAMDSTASGSQSSVSVGTQKNDIASNASTQLCLDSAMTVGTDTAIASTVVTSSSRSSATNILEKGDRQTSQESSSRLLTDTEQALVQTDVSSAAPSRGIKRSRDDMEASSEDSPAPSPQKNKRRCFVCSCKLELAQRAIGRCRCDRVYCALHRLPEMHDCEFNHKEDGRREAREKMVKPTRHLGPSYRREDAS